MKSQTTSTTRVKTLRSKRFTPRNAPLAMAICAALSGGVTPLYAAPGDAVGVEFRVNTETASIQSFPSIAMDADGDFVVSWQSYAQDASGGFGIYAQRYNGDGSSAGNEFRVNTETANDQSNPSIAMDGDGDFVISWESDGQDSSGLGIYAQRYNADGSPAGNEFRVNTETTNDQSNPSIAMDVDGDFVVSWHSYAQDGSTWGIYSQRYNADGTPVGIEFRVNTETTGIQVAPSIAMDVDGNFVVSWSSSYSTQDGGGWSIYAQRYNADGITVGNEFRVNTETVNSQINPAIAMDADGDFVVSWESDGQDGGGWGIYAQRYNANGTPVGNEFRVNTETAGTQRFPSIAMDADGDFVVSWQSYPQDGSNYGVYAQRYTANGVSVGNEFRVNTETAGNQRNPSIAMDADGDFVASWQSFGQDGSSAGVYAQRYEGAGNTVDLNLVIQDDTDPVTTGNNFVYTLITTNNGSGIALGNTLAAVLPTGLTYVSDDSSTVGWNCALNVATLECNKGFLNAAQVSAIAVTVTADSAGAIDTTANVSSAQTDTNLTDNSDTETTTIGAAVVPTPASGGGGGGSLSGFSLLMLIPLALMRRFKAEE